MIMTSSSKDQTENTPPLLSDASTGASAPQSAPSVETDNTPPSTPTTPKSSEPTKKGATTDERIRQHADMFRVTAKWLERHGLIKRYKVLSKDGQQAIEIRLVLSPDVWTDGLELRLLSEKE